MDSTLDKLSAFATSFGYSDLTPRAIHETKRRLIDSFGCGIGGFSSTVVTMARRFADRCSSDPGARILGTGRLSTIDGAAFANAVAIRYLDANDTYISTGGAHPSDMIAGLMAVAEAYHNSGQDLLLATALGYEVICACLDEVNTRARGWDQGVFLGFATAAGAGRLLGLTREQMAQAISIAAVHSIPVRQTRSGELSMWKACATPAAVRSGVFSALLAKEGMEGPYEPFEGENGLWQQATGPFELKTLGSPGGPLAIERSNLKFFASEYHSQAILGLTQEIHKRVPVDEIEAINVESYWLTYHEIGRGPERWDPKTRETADHSLPYVMACCLRDGVVNPASFSQDRVLDPSLRPLMNKISVRENPEFTRLYPQALISEVEVISTRGDRLVLRADYPKGHPKNPMSDEDVQVKFRWLCDGVLSPEQVDEALEAIWSLDEAPQAGTILDRLIVADREQA